MPSTTATRVIPKTVTLQLDLLSDAMKQLGLTGVSAQCEHPRGGHSATRISRVGVNQHAHGRK
jgi:hypothetical protein